MFFFLGMIEPTKEYRVNEVTCVIFSVLMLATSTAFAVDLSDAAFAKACPADAAWVAAQQHSVPLAKEHLSNAQLRSEIDKRFDADQSARNAISASQGDKSLVAKVIEVDQSNLPWLKQQIAKYGFPSVAEVGHKGVEEIFMLTQHADSDPAFQVNVLTLMEPLVDANEVSKKAVAFLTDRVLVAQGKPQRYGTQFGKDSHGKRMLQPVEHETDLDKRRASMDLEPESDYKCRMDFVFGK